MPEGIFVLGEEHANGVRDLRVALKGKPMLR